MKKRIRMGQFDFPNPEWQNVSKDAKELIKGMLNIDPSQRLDIVQVMSNKWIAVRQLTCLIKFLLKNLYFTHSNTLKCLRRRCLLEGC
jgi:serine/threonine protein kinase